MRHFNRPTLTQPSSPRPVPSTCILAKRSIPAQWLAVRWLGHVAIVFVTELGHLHRQEAPETTLSGFVFSFPRRAFYGLKPPLLSIKLFEGFDWWLPTESLSPIFKKYNSYDNEYIFKLQYSKNMARNLPSCHVEHANHPAFEVKIMSHEVICLPKI